MLVQLSSFVAGRKWTPAFPASIRWTAPEVLCHPTADETMSDVFGPAVDVYGFGMTVWEAMNAADPWFEIHDEDAVSICLTSNCVL